MLAASEANKAVRDELRNRHLEVKSNAHFDLINGKPRHIPTVSPHEAYNNGQEPNPDLAGRPVRYNSKIAYNEGSPTSNGKKQYMKSPTVGKTIPYNAPPLVSGHAQKTAPLTNDPAAYGATAGHPTVAPGHPGHYKPVSSYGHVPLPTAGGQAPGITSMPHDQ